MEYAVGVFVVVEDDSTAWDKEQGTVVNESESESEIVVVLVHRHSAVDVGKPGKVNYHFVPMSSDEPEEEVGISAEQRHFHCFSHLISL
jgi:hypothetical protein